MRGYVWAGLSILLVSGAQLCLKWAMIQLPPFAQPGAFWLALQALTPGAIVLGAGLAAYALSVLCWVAALHYISLSRAYPLLSLSYILVWGAALLLPALQETFYWGTLGGVVLISAGLALICWPSSR